MNRSTPHYLIPRLLGAVLALGVCLYAGIILRLEHRPFMSALVQAARGDPIIHARLGSSFTLGVQSGYTRQKGRSVPLYTGQLYLYNGDSRCYVRGRAFEPQMGGQFKVGKLIVRCT